MFAYKGGSVVVKVIGISDIPCSASKCAIPKQGYIFISCALILNFHSK